MNIHTILGHGKYVSYINSSHIIGICNITWQQENWTQLIPPQEVCSNVESSLRDPQGSYTGAALHRERGLDLQYKYTDTNPVKYHSIYIQFE